MPIYRITAPLIECRKKLQNVKITIRNAQVVGSSPIPSSIVLVPARWLTELFAGIFCVESPMVC